MTAKLARLPNVPEQVDSAQRNRRKEQRFATWFDAQLESGGRERTDVRLTDVSMHGCRIMSENARLRVGAFVAISIDEGAKQQAIIRWVRDTSAGMEFLRPIPPSCTEWHDLIDEGY